MYAGSVTAPYDTLLVARNDYTSKKARFAYNVNAERHFAASICSIIAIFVLLHWIRRLASGSKLIPQSLARPFVVVSRHLRSRFVRSLPGFGSTGHALLVAVYVSINLILLLTTVALSDSHFGGRFGWVALANLVFVTFLALKNTPLAFLTAYSYERLNALHKIVGYMCFVLVVCHAIIYTAYYYQEDRVEDLREPKQIAGIVAGFMFFLMASSAIVMRRYWYELFYALHLLGFAGVLIGTGIHRPSLAKKVPIILSVTAAMFVADRLLRWMRLLVSCVNNSATVFPLPHGGTRILLAKRPPFAFPGKHLFLWFPSLRPLETHPFTIVNTSVEGHDGPTEFIIKSYNGFTRTLHAFAVKNPGASLFVGAEGPYGTFPDPLEYDKVILIAGGSGGSYTFGMAVHMLERMGPGAHNNVIFVWAAKTEEYITWYADHLKTLQMHLHAPKVTVSLHVTQALGSASVSASASAFSEDEAGTALPGAIMCEKGLGLVQETTQTISDPEKGAHRGTSSASGASSPGLRHVINSGRPDTATVIREAIATTDVSQRVLVAACGPSPLMAAVRNATATCIKVNGPSVELHCEEFGW